MKYDFNQRINRNRTNSFKWDFIKRNGGIEYWDETNPALHEKPVLPMWVADMDFPSPQPVIEAIEAQAQTGIYGYAYTPPSYYDAVVNWMDRRHGWKIERDWICYTPGVVPGLHLMVATYLKPGEKVLLQPPVYYPFYLIAENTDTEAVLNPLIYKHGHYHMDFEDLEEKCADPDLKAAILCSPHNPVGRVWSAEELRRFGEICLKHDVLVISDEIHGDLIFSDHSFTPFATLGHEFADRSITCTAASKTFNLAGLQTSNMVIQNDDLREAFQTMCNRSGVFTLNMFGILSLEAAYNHGEEWLEQLMVYLEDNYRFLETYFKEHLPECPVIKPEGTYLVWIDFRSLGLDKDELEDLMMNKARIYFDEGYIFGPEGEGFERINIACPRSILTEALDRIKEAVRSVNI
jgi:cystathionine beta-lyase